MMNTCPRLLYEKTEHGIALTACYGIDGRIFLPDKIVCDEGDAPSKEGISLRKCVSYPITAIAPYAFAEKEICSDDLVWEDPELVEICNIRHLKTTDIEEIRLPQGIREIGRYAFYRCRNLKKLTLSDGILDIGGGAFTGCHLEEAEIHFHHGEQSALKSIVDEVRFSIHARLYYYGGAKEAQDVSAMMEEEKRQNVQIADVLFPEHYEEAVENTPARLLYTSHHGAGGYYRQCFYNRELDYKKYDSLLPWAIAEETEEVVIRLSMGRLKYPYKLSESARENYLAYIREHEETAVKLFVTEEDIESIRFLSEQKLWTEKAVSVGIDAASKLGKTEIAGLLMEEKHKNGSRRKRTFEL